MITSGRGFPYLTAVSALSQPEHSVWVADLRLFIPVEKGWLVGCETGPAFTEEWEYDRFADRVASRFARRAFATAIVDHVIGPTLDLLRGIAADFEGLDPIVEVGLATGRSRLDPTNAQLVFMLDAELPDDLRARIVDWWEPTAEAARAAGIETLMPRFVGLDQLSAAEYRTLDLLDAAALSPQD
jgi:hypothetical protein